MCFSGDRFLGCSLCLSDASFFLGCGNSGLLQTATTHFVVGTKTGNVCRSTHKKTIYMCGSVFCSELFHCAVNVNTLIASAVALLGDCEASLYCQICAN